MKRLIKRLTQKNWFFNLSTKMIRKTIKNDPYYLTSDDLSQNGWVKNSDDYWFEPNVKGMDKIWVKFFENDSYYKLYHGKEKTFITLETSVKWFMTYFYLINKESIEN